uniref:Cytochrome p450 6a14-like protein n=1 Tax=Prodiamesa olivacea TaxID=288840 RepID=A0A7T7JPK6_9DIPT|nr:cytochrome p450 6a14-like protein [Prodiamesa olivacea]
MDLSIGLYLLLAIATLVVWYVKKSFSFWSDLGVTQFPVSFPRGNFVGVGIVRNFSEVMLEYYEKTKQAGVKFSGIYSFTRPLFLATDLELVKSILVRDFNVFPNRGVYFNEKHDPISAHIFNLENEPWRNLRQKLSPTFTSGKLKMMYGTIHDATEKLLETIGKQVSETGQLEVKDVLARFTTDIIGTTAFGIDCNSLENKDSKFYVMGCRIFTQVPTQFVRFLTGTFKGLSRKLGVVLTDKEVSDFYMQITKETVEYREKNPQIKRQDFMSLLVDMKKSNILTVEQIAAQSFVFYLAGFETSSSTMTYCMYELSINEEIQEKVRRSVKKVLEKHNNELTYEAVNDMDYLEQCVSETLRKYPVVPVLIRTPVKAYKIPGTNIVIPKNQPVLIPVQAIQMDPEIYPEPEKYDPDRFEPEEIKKRHQFSYLPFGEGPRICIGMRFGLLEAKIGLARILLNYKFKLDRSKTSVPLKMMPKSFVLSPTESIFLNVEKISN